MFRSQPVSNAILEILDEFDELARIGWGFRDQRLR
jgi:hypothetical protein